MPKHRRNPQATLAKYKVHTRTGRLQFLIDVAKAYEQLYPARFRFYLNQFKKLRQVRHDKSGSFRDEKGRTYFTDSIPTEPFLFVQRWIPDFGYNDGDMELLKKAWEDFIITASQKHLKKSTLWKGALHVPPHYTQAEATAVDVGSRPAKRCEIDLGRRSGECPPVGDDDHEGLPDGTGEVPEVGDRGPGA